MLPPVDESFTGPITDMTVTPYRCDDCGTTKTTKQLRPPNLTFICGMSRGYPDDDTPCEGDRFLKYVVAPIVPEPQEP